MGWSGSGFRRRDIVLGSTVDVVVREANADLFAERFHDAADGVADANLVTTAGGPHASLAVESARANATAEDASVEVPHVIPTDAEPGAGADASTPVEDVASRSRLAA